MNANELRIFIRYFSIPMSFVTSFGGALVGFTFARAFLNCQHSAMEAGINVVLWVAPVVQIVALAAVFFNYKSKLKRLYESGADSITGKSAA